MTTKYAVIDIGSNSVRLMLWAGGTLYKKVRTTRLAQGLADSGMLSDAAMERTAEAVSAFAEEGARAGARVLAFATAAVRSSENGTRFCSLVKDTCGIFVDVVTGEEEARLGLCGALGREDGGIIDIGGASTEVCIRCGGEIRYSCSLPVGAVRIFDACGQDPSRIETFVRASVAPLADVRCAASMRAIGGTASTLASIRLGLQAYDAEKLNGLVLPRAWLEEMSLRLLSLSPEERKGVPGMDVSRADVIAGASRLLVNVMRALGLPQVRFSDADNLEGYLFVRGLV